MEKRALAGNQFARRTVISAIAQGSLGQQREQRTHSLLAWIALGDERALLHIDLSLQLRNVPTLYDFLKLLHSPQ